MVLARVVEGDLAVLLYALLLTLDEQLSRVPPEHMFAVVPKECRVWQ